ncbi:MAG: TRAP transporter large permease [Bacillota bacterium]|jgi:tripartite ATP-independent transporter DctM subunit
MFFIMLLTCLFLIFLLVGMPVAFALGIPLVVYLVMNWGAIPVAFMANSMVSHLISFTLLALPAFLLSGKMMNTCGVTERLFDFAIAVVGRLRGGLAHANCLASMMFASMSGTAVGDAGGLGAIELNMMTKAGYSRDFATGVTAASSILGPIIPPSAAMVLLGSLAGMSIGSLFMGGLIPGILLGAALMGYIYLRSIFTEEGRNWPVEKVPFRQVLKTIPPAFFPMLSPVIILGGITLGVVTPTEAAILAIDYSLILGICYHKVTFKSLWETLEATVETTGVFLFIMAVAGFFTWVVIREGLPQLLQAGLANIYTFSPLIVMFIMAAILLVIGCFLDTSAACILVTPVLMPVVTRLGIDPIYFGVVMIIALMIGIITPPFGICLFVLSDVSGISVKRVTKEAVRYIPAMAIILILIIIFPQIVTWIPNTLLK